MNHDGCELSSQGQNPWPCEPDPAPKWESWASHVLNPGIWRSRWHWAFARPPKWEAQNSHFLSPGKSSLIPWAFSKGPTWGARLWFLEPKLTITLGLCTDAQNQSVSICKTTYIVLPHSGLIQFLILVGFWFAGREPKKIITKVQGSKAAVSIQRYREEDSEAMKEDCLRGSQGKNKVCLRDLRPRNTQVRSLRIRPSPNVLEEETVILREEKSSGTMEVPAKNDQEEKSRRVGLRLAFNAQKAKRREEVWKAVRECSSISRTLFF